MLVTKEYLNKKLDELQEKIDKQTSVVRHRKVSLLLTHLNLYEETPRLSKRKLVPKPGKGE